MLPNCKYFHIKEIFKETIPLFLNFVLLCFNVCSRFPSFEKLFQNLEIFWDFSKQQCSKKCEQGIEGIFDPCFA